MISDYEYTIFPSCLNLSSSAVSQCSVPATKLLASSKVYNAEAITAGLEAAGCWVARLLLRPTIKSDCCTVPGQYRPNFTSTAAAAAKQQK